MAESATAVPDELELQVDAAIALCDGDPRAALRAALVYNEFLERKLEQFRTLVSSGYTRGSVSPVQQASTKLDDWREIAASKDPASVGGGKTGEE